MPAIEEGKDEGTKHVSSFNAENQGGRAACALDKMVVCVKAKMTVDWKAFGH